MSEVSHWDRWPFRVEFSLKYIISSVTIPFLASHSSSSSWLVAKTQMSMPLSSPVIEVNLTGTTSLSWYCWLRSMRSFEVTLNVRVYINFFLVGGTLDLEGKEDSAEVAVVLGQTLAVLGVEVLVHLAAHWKILVDASKYYLEESVPVCARCTRRSIQMCFRLSSPVPPPSLAPQKSLYAAMS